MGAGCGNDFVKSYDTVLMRTGLFSTALSYKHPSTSGVIFTRARCAGILNHSSCESSSWRPPLEAGLSA
jgi:hypothetical protein